MSEQEVKTVEKETPSGKDGRSGKKAGYYRLIFIVLALGGLLVSLELTRVWVKVRTEPGYESICAVNQELNCMTVAESAYSAFLGIPVSVWGVAAYLSMLAVACFFFSGSKERRNLAVSLNAALSLVSVITSLGLLYISEVLLEVLCPYCILIYVLNMLLFPFALLLFFGEGGVAGLKSLFSLFRERGRLARVSAPVLISIIALSAVSMGAFKLAFSGLTTAPPEACRQDQNMPTIKGGLKAGFTEDGRPWIGAADPRAVITEFTDYQCPHCRKSHADLRRMLTDYHEKIRIVHKHLPLDHNCHPLIKREYHPCACKYSYYAVCAAEQGIKSFWKMNDYLFNLPRQKECVSTQEAVEATGVDPEKFRICMESKLPEDKVHHDVMEGINLEINATPTYVCDGNTLPGSISRKTLEKIISECEGNRPVK
ncbi:MAG: vitamin K epoxide reductase family protein [bacterium]